MQITPLSITVQLDPTGGIRGVSFTYSLVLPDGHEVQRQQDMSTWQLDPTATVASQVASALTFLTTQLRAAGFAI